MCRPTHYDVVHENLNFHMNMQTSVNKHQAHMQYWNLVRKISSCGANIKFIESQNNLVDMVFAANGALIDKATHTAIIANFAAKPRIEESNLWKSFLKNNSFKIKMMKNKFEGQGDALFSHSDKILWYGYGFRSSYEAASELKSVLQHVTIQTLKLVDERFYHLDTCFCVLSNDSVMYYPNAFDDESQKKIENMFQIKIIVSEYDAQKFSCNAICIYNNVFLHEASLNLRNSLNEIGYTVIENNMSEFLLSGGSAKCCVMHA